VSWWERKLWTRWLLTCCSKKGWGYKGLQGWPTARVSGCCSKKGWAAEKSSKKGGNRKEKCFLSSHTRWSWQNKRARTSFWTCSSSPGHWSHTRETSSSLNFQSMRTQAESTYIAHNMFGQVKMKLPWYNSRHTHIYRKRGGKPRMICDQKQL